MISRLRLPRPSRAAAALLLVAALAALSSCISALERDYVRYDPAKDEFHMLMLLQNIQAKDTGDVAYLVALYANRDHWITPVVPGGYLLPLVGNSLIRASNSEFSSLNLFGSRPSSFDKITTAAPLNDITITPGEFFSEKGPGSATQLGYYQAITVPGKVIDAALAEASTALQTDDAVKALDAEIARRSSGGKVATWDQLKTEAVAQITAGDSPAATQAAGEDITPLMVLDQQSLDHLKEALAAKSLKISRDKTLLTLTLPLSPRDAAGFADLYQALIARLRQVAGTTPKLPDDQRDIDQAKAFAAIAPLLKIQPDAAGVRLSIDVLDYAKAAASIPQRVDLNNPSKDDAAQSPPPDLFAALKTNNIPVDDHLSADQILKDFNAGTLKGHPSDRPVTPGQGIPNTP